MDCIGVVGANWSHPDIRPSGIVIVAMVRSEHRPRRSRMASQDMNVVDAADVRLELDDSGTSVRSRCCMQI